MNEKLLIVEDDVEIARIIIEHLKRERYEINWASTGIEGMEEFKNEKYDLIIADIMMPEMDGFTLCKNVRFISDVPILIISARHSDIDKVKGLKLGADDYLTKPFSLVELTARIESHLRRYKRYEKGSDTEICKYIGGLSIDKDKRLVMLNGKDVALTAKEFELLILMAQNADKTFTKKELYEYVWNQCNVDGNNTVTVHIKCLREKLEENVKNPLFIQTVWGTGYKFVGERIS